MGNSSIATRIQTMRMSRGISQTDLAKKIGVSRSTIAMWEIGSRVPNWDMVEALADVFNVRASAIYEDDDPNEEREIWELREAIRNNPALLKLFSITRNAPPATVDKIVKVSQILCEED